jgi:hypothetical protein
MAVPLADIGSCKGPKGVRSPGIDVAKQTALNLVVDGRSEERRIKVELPKGARRGRVESGSLRNDSPIIENPLRRHHVKIGKRVAVRFEESLLEPSGNIVIVSRLRHRRHLYRIAIGTRNVMRSVKFALSRLSMTDVFCTVMRWTCSGCARVVCAW